MGVPFWGCHLNRRFVNFLLQIFKNPSVDSWYISYILSILLSLYCHVNYLFLIFFHRSPLERCFLYPGKNCHSPSMGAHHGPIDGPWQKGRRTIDGNAMVHRWPMDGLAWDPNSGLNRFCFFPKVSSPAAGRTFNDSSSVIVTALKMEWNLFIFLSRDSKTT